MSTHNPLDARYREVRPQYEAFTNKLVNLIKELLIGENIKTQAIESRTKELASFSEKLQRPGKNYGASFSDVPDLSGIRIITYYTDEVDRIADLLKREFKVDSKQYVNQSDLLQQNEFGYLSIHFVLSISEARASLPEWSKLADLKAEVQIRTVLQHAWAAVSHALQYKSKGDVPKQLQRRLYRLCGIFELADEEFLGIKNAHHQLSEEIGKQIQDSSLDIAISTTSLNEYLDQRPIESELAGIGNDVGWNVGSPHEWHDQRPEDTSGLSAVCALLDIRTLAELDQRIKSLGKSGERWVKFLAQEYPKWNLSPCFMLSLLLLLQSPTWSIGQLRVALNMDDTIGESLLKLAMLIQGSSAEVGENARDAKNG